MLPSSSGDVTLILKQWDDDRDSSMRALTPIVYDELHKIAAAYLRRERPDHTLQPTALIHEAYLRLVNSDLASLQDRSHFYMLAARMMRQILVDAARAHYSLNAGPGRRCSSTTSWITAKVRARWSFWIFMKRCRRYMSTTPVLPRPWNFVTSVA